jgi:hypothetical protein
VEAMTPKAFLVNRGITVDQCLEELNKRMDKKISKRGLQDRLNGVSEWSALELIALCDYLEIDDVKNIKLKF